MKLFTDTIKRSNKESMNIKWKNKESKMRRKKKFKSLETYKRRPLTGKVRLTQSEPKERSRPKRGKPDKSRN